MCLVCLPRSLVTVAPTGPIPLGSTLRLVGSLHPNFAASKIHWVRSAAAISMKAETLPKTGTVAKLPQVQLSDKGAYVCMVQPWGNSSSELFAFNVDVSVDGKTDSIGLNRWEDVPVAPLLMAAVGIFIDIPAAALFIKAFVSALP